MIEMLLNLYDGRISVEGNGFQYEYIKGAFEEIETEEGFKLIGKLNNGDSVAAFLTFEEYFEGKEFRIK